MKKLLLLILCVACVMSVSLSCAKDTNGPSTPTDKTATPTFTITVSATATATATVTVTATVDTTLMVIGSLKKLMIGYTEAAVAVERNSVDVDTATVTVRNVTKATAAIKIPYVLASSRFQVDSYTATGLIYYPGDTYELSVTTNGATFTKQGQAVGAISFTPYSAGAGVTASWTYNGTSGDAWLYRSGGIDAPGFPKYGVTGLSPYNYDDTNFAAAGYYQPVYQVNKSYLLIDGIAHVASGLELAEQATYSFTK